MNYVLYWMILDFTYYIKGPVFSAGAGSGGSVLCDAWRKVKEVEGGWGAS